MVPRRRELEAASGIAEPQRERLALGSDSSLKLAANGTLSLGSNATAGDESFSAFGVHANLSVVGKQEILGQFEDGGVAVARALVRYFTTSTANCIIIAQILHFSYCFQGQFCKLPLLRAISIGIWAIVMQFAVAFELCLLAKQAAGLGW